MPDNAGYLRTSWVQSEGPCGRARHRTIGENGTVLGQGWQSQWARVQRRLNDVRSVYAGRPGGTDDAIDIVLSFFETVHHLKDWLGNDQLSGITEAAGDSLINGSKMLQLCADLANGSKHRVSVLNRGAADPAPAPGPS